MSIGSPRQDLDATQPSRSRSRLKVLQMIGFMSSMGGAERFTSALARALPGDRFETWVCCPRGGEPDAISELEQAGVRFVDLGRREKLDYHRVAGLVSLLRRERFDVLHSHMFGSNVWASLYGKACGVPVLIAHEHTWSYQGKPLRVWLDGHLVGRLTSRFVAVSDADARRMVSLEGVPPHKVTVIPTAYIPSRSTVTSNVRAELGLGSNAPLIGTAAVMRDQKRLDVLVSAHAQLPGPTASEAHLVLAGEGPVRAGLQRQARALGTESRVHFLGRRDDIDAIIGSLDVAVMSSDYEGLPLFAFECMANRTPLVATRVGGLPDLIDSGRTGLLVPPREPFQLAQAIGSLLDDPERARGMAASAAAGLDDYQMGEIAGRFADLYENLAQAKLRG